MPSRIVDWYATHPHTYETMRLVNRWLDIRRDLEEANRLLWDLERWLGERTTPPPDLCIAVALYGRAHLAIMHWRLPIDVPPDEIDAWRADGFLMTREDAEDELAGIAGGFLELAAREPQTIVADLLVSQLRQRRDDLDSELAAPIEKWTPADFDDEALDDMADTMEFEEFDGPFALRQLLEYFELAMERLRPLAMTEAPELGLPSRALFESLMEIDLNALIRGLAGTDEALNRILAHLAEFNYRDGQLLNEPLDPPQFWWRHWKVKRRTGRRR